jgi:hypothetical protein
LEKSHVTLWVLMDFDERKLNKLEKLLSLVDEEYVKSDEFIEVFTALIGLIRDVEEDRENTAEKLNKQAQELREIVSGERKLSRKLQEQFNERLDRFVKDLKSHIEKVRDEIELQVPEKGDPGEPGKNGEPGKDGSPDTGEQIVGKINDLKGKGPKIKAENITDLPTAVTTIVERGGFNVGGFETPIKDATTGKPFPKDASGAYLISAGGGSGASTFAELTGDPYDNSELGDALDLKANIADVQYKTFVTVGSADADYLVGDYSDDIGLAIQAAYDALPDEGGQIFIKSGTYEQDTGVEFGTDGKIVSLIGANAGSTFIKFTPTSGTAFIFNSGNPTAHLVYEIVGITFMGSPALIAAAQANTRTNKGLFFGGANGCPGAHTHDCIINGFGTQIEIGSNAYMLTFTACGISGGNGVSGTSTGLQGSLVHINTASNSGERNVFSKCNFTDPGNSIADNAIYIEQGGTATNFFNNCSFDNVQVRILGSNGMTVFNNAHVEDAAFATYGEYIPFYFDSASSNYVLFNGLMIADSSTNASTNFDTIIKHGVNLKINGWHLENYGGQTVTYLADHSLNNGSSSELISGGSVQGGGLTNISRNWAYSAARAVGTHQNYANSYGTGFVANSNNTVDWKVGNNVTALQANENGDVTAVRDVSVGRALLPVSNDGGAIGSGTLMFSDLFIASGGVINFNNGDVTLTHSANALAMDGGGFVFNEAGGDFDFRIEGDTDANLFFVDASTDRVAIGTNTPEEKFDVVGNFKVRDAATETKAYRFRTNGGALDLEFGGANLYISGWSGADFTGSQYQIMEFQSGGGSTLFKRGVIFNNDASGDQDFQLKGDTDDNMLFGDVSSNRVGFGTASPDEKVHVVGKIKTTGGVLKRVVTTTDDATAVIDVDVTDVYELSAVANNTTFTLTGTATDGQTIVVRYKDAGVSKTLTWTGFTAIGVTLPTATTAGKWGYVGMMYNSAASAWHVIAVTTEA